MILDKIPRVKLATFPTPLDEAPRLAKKLGLRKLLIKRDDCTSLGNGGNKVRKLEYLIADALGNKADIVITDGGPQSNHARLTAAACRKAGIERCMLFLGGPEFEKFDGNLLLNIILGAEIKFIPDATVKEMEAAMQKEADSLRSQGSNPYVIPIGGSTPLGALGYVNAIRELSDQLGPDEQSPYIFVAVGSAGTIAGCALGVRMFMPDAQLIGISVARKSKPLRSIAASIATEAAKLINVDETFQPADLVIDDRHYGDRYGIPSPEGNKAILTAAQTEGIILDPVYTGKAMSGLIDLAITNSIDTNRTAVFIHTGGTPAIFAFEEHFRNLANFETLN